MRKIGLFAAGVLFGTIGMAVISAALAAIMMIFVR